MSLVRALCLLSAVEWLARGHGQGAAPAVQLCCNFGACSPPIRTAAVPRSPAQLGKPLSPPLSCLAPAVHDLPLPTSPTSHSKASGGGLGLGYTFFQGSNFLKRGAQCIQPGL